MYLFEEFSADEGSIPKYVVFKDQNGTQWPFIVEKQDGIVTGYTTPNGSPYTMDKVNGLYQLTDDSGLVYSFNSNLKLASVLDQPFIQELSEPVNEDTILDEVIIYNHSGSLNWAFDAVYVSGSLDHFTAKDSNCPFALSLSNNEYVLTETANTSMIYTFETNDPAGFDEFLTMTTTVTSGSAIKATELQFTYRSEERRGR